MVAGLMIYMKCKIDWLVVVTVHGCTEANVQILGMRHTIIIIIIKDTMSLTSQHAT